MAPITYFEWLLKYQMECFDKKLLETDLDRSLMRMFQLRNIIQMSLSLTKYYLEQKIKLFCSIVNS